MKVKRTFALAAAVAMMTAGPAFAQHPADNHAIGQVNTQVGGELYGHNSNTLYLRPYQFQLLPSEERYAAFRSGALPSELELNRSSIGPLTPNGVLDYIPRLTPLQRDLGVQLYNHAYDLTLQPRTNDDPGNVQPGFKLAPNAAKQGAKVRTVAPASTMPGSELPSAQLPTGQLQSLPESLPAPFQRTKPANIRHGTLLIKPQPSTQPTPPPKAQL